MASGSPRRASLTEALRTVLAGFLGVRRRADHDRDTARVTPVQIVVIAVALVVTFIFVLISVVRTVVGA